jgi:hypothetical protein
MNQREIEPLLRKALELLRDRDWLLLEYEVGERAVASKLACYLAPLFPEHDVDVEYNRHGLDPKDLDLPADCHGGGTKLIVPDVIVHRRGHDRDNLLVVEVKKETNPESRACDRAKIEGMKRHFHYVCGVLLDMPAGADARNREPRMEWV